MSDDLCGKYFTASLFHLIPNHLQYKVPWSSQEDHSNYNLHRHIHKLEDTRPSLVLRYELYPQPTLVSLQLHGSKQCIILLPCHLCAMIKKKKKR